MKTLLFTSLIFFFCVKSYAQNIDDTIHWRENYKIRWEDFIGIPNSDRWSAVIYTLLEYKYYRHSLNYTFLTSAVMYKQKSWVDTNKVQDYEYSLNHEQKHFDLSEIYARKLLTALKNAELTSSNIRSESQRICDKISSELDTVQVEYDRQTLHGNNYRIQEEWNEKIKKMLQNK